MNRGLAIEKQVNGSFAHIESRSSAHIANESSAHREPGPSAHIERSSAHIDAGYQLFRVCWGVVRGGTKASLILETRVGSMDLNHHLTQPFRVWLGGWGGDKSVHVPLHTKALHLDRLSSEALHLEHSPGQGRGGTKAFMFLSSAHKSTAPSSPVI